jgi:hypothetical protein
MTNRVGLLCAAAVLLAASAPVLAAGAPESFTATASVKTGPKPTTAPVKISVDRYSTEEERSNAMSAIRSGGTHALRETVAKMSDAGSIEIGGKKTPIKYAYARSTGSGRLLTLITADPILNLGSGMPEFKPVAGHDVAAALLVLDEKGGGHGEFAPVATLKTNKSGSILVEDYGKAKVWLKNISKTK